MSYYFNIRRAANLSPTDILEGLDAANVRVLADDNFDTDAPIESDFQIYIPGLSTRGVRIYRNDAGGFDVGINAFATADDARLGRDTACMIAQRCSALVEPEDHDPVKPEQMAAIFGSEWVNQRVREGETAIAIALAPENGEASVPCYRREFTISGEYLHTLSNPVDNKRELLQLLHAKCCTLQELEVEEDIFVPTIMKISPPTPDDNSRQQGKIQEFFKSANRILGLGQSSKLEPAQRPSWTAINLAEDVRTLSRKADFVILHNATDDTIWRLPFDEFLTHALGQAWRRYDAVSFDIPPLTGGAYQTLVDQAKIEF